MLRALWWALFIVAALWAQRLVPGVDFLAAGLAVSLQNESRARSVFLAVIFVLIQEGVGSQPFGAALLWYWILALLYSLGGWLFQARSLPFMALLGLALGLTHFLLTFAMATLAVKGVPFDRVLNESLLQAVAFPVEWALADRAYPASLRDNGQPV